MGGVGHAGLTLWDVTVNGVVLRAMVVPFLPRLVFAGGLRGSCTSSVALYREMEPDLELRGGSQDLNQHHPQLTFKSTGRAPWRNVRITFSSVAASYL